MESQFLNLKTLDKTPEFVSTKRILFFRDENAVEKYIRFVGPHFIDAVFVSADGEYPQNPQLKEKVLKTLSSDESAMVVVFNSDAFSRFTVATQRILILDSVLIHSYRYYEPYLEYRMDLTAPQISKIIGSFFAQWDILSTETNFSLNYSTGTMYVPPRELDWRFEMLGFSPRRILADELVMFETIFYRLKGFLASQAEGNLFPEIKDIEQEFTEDFDYSRDRFFSFNYKKLMVGAISVRVVGHSLFVRCFCFEPTYNTPENYRLGLEVLQRAFPHTQTITAIIPHQHQSQFERMGFVVEAQTAHGSLKIKKGQSGTAL